LADERPKILIVGGPQDSAADIQRAVGDQFEVVHAPQGAALMSAVGGDPASLVGTLEDLLAKKNQPTTDPKQAWAVALLNAIGEGACLARADGEPVWANDFYMLIDESTRHRLKAVAAEGAHWLAEQGGNAETMPARRFDIPSPDGTRLFEVFVSGVSARAPGMPSPAAAAAAGVKGHLEHVAVVVRDVTATNRTRMRLDAIDRAGSELVRLEATTIRKMNVIERLKLLETKVVRFSRDLLHFDHFGIRLLDERSGKLELVMAHGVPSEYDAIDIYAKADGNGISGYVAATGTSYICHDASRDELFLPGVLGARSSLTVPLRLHDKVIGIMNVESQQPHAFGDDDRQLAEIFARNVALAVHMLDLLVVERTETNQTISGRMSHELSEPLADILHEVEVLKRRIASEPEMSGHVTKIQADVEAIRQRLQDVAAGPTSLLGAEKALAVKTIDPDLADKHVLIADDQPKIRRIIGDVLRNRGCTVVITEDGGQAIVQLEQAARGESRMFDLVVSDIKMPDRNGYEVFAAARRIKPDLPVILMTGFGYDPHHSIVRASQEGLQDVLYKPFQVEQLVELVRKALKFGGRDGITAAS
jgi:CheY-like chemotaxis protein/putative methionine-R-sulfoxide reductase with GAF domain